MQQAAPSLLGLCCPGLPRLLQQQVVLCSSVAQQLHSHWMPGRLAAQAVKQQQQQQRGMSGLGSNGDPAEQKAAPTAADRAATEAKLAAAAAAAAGKRNADGAAAEGRRNRRGSKQSRDDVQTASTGSGSSSSSSFGNDNSSCSPAARRRARGFAAHRARLPRVRKYGPELRERDPAAFERMRLLLGYYDLPGNSSMPRPPPPSHAVINNLQALRFTKDVDPYYKLALLSYRGKLENLQLLQTLAKTRSFLQQLSAPPAFVPANLEALSSAAPAAAATAAPTAVEQQQQQQEGSTDAK